MNEEQTISNDPTVTAEKSAPQRKAGFSQFSKLFDVMGERSLKQIITSLPFILFLLLLAFSHIANNHYADQMVRQITRAEKKLKEYRWEYMTVTSKLMKASRQSEMAKRMKEYELQELRQVPKTLVVENE
jgi:hypothetical protein